MDAPSSPAGDTQFGVFVGLDGALFDDDGDLNDDGKLDTDITKPARQLEDTGVNRVLGADQSARPNKFDRLYGGTGLDFMYGFGAHSSSPDQLYDRTGNSFDTRGALAATSGRSMPSRPTKFGTTVARIETT